MLIILSTRHSACMVLTLIFAYKPVMSCYRLPTLFAWSRLKKCFCFFVFGFFFCFVFFVFWVFFWLFCFIVVCLSLFYKRVEFINCPNVLRQPITIIDTNQNITIIFSSEVHILKRKKIINSEFCVTYMYIRIICRKTTTTKIVTSEFLLVACLHIKSKDFKS